MAAVLLHLILLLQAHTETAPSTISTHDQALTFYRKGDYTQAAKLFEQDLKENSSDRAKAVETYILLAHCYYAPGKWKEALPWLEKAVEAGVLSNEVNYMLGNAYIQDRQTTKAQQAFAHMFNVPPDSAAAHLLTAQFMMRQQSEDDAQKEATAALSADGRIPQAHYLLGEIATFRGRIDEAIAEFRKEIALNPDFAMAYYKLGDAYSHQEEWALAIPQLQSSIWLNPTYSGPFILLGKAYWKKGELENAEGTLRRAITLDPRNSSAHYILGQTLMQLGRADEGRQMLKKSQELQR